MPLQKILLFYCFIITGYNAFSQSVLNEKLIRQLDTIGGDDQAPRAQLETIRNKYAGDTAQLRLQLRKQFRLMKEKDSVNLAKVALIIDRYGWQGADAVGASGNSTLFLVIQHADLPAQDKYLPVMREAVKKGQAKAGSLALLEDRVALLHHKRQIYGSQLAWNMLNNTYYILPLVDPDNVDKRRLAVGLPPLADYIQEFHLTWNVEQYKKDLPSIEVLYPVVAK